MKNFKKLLALVIAGAMTIGSMSMGTFAAAGDRTADTAITITNLEKGDDVNLYKILKWTDGVGWELADGYSSLSSNANIAKLINGSQSEKVELTKDDIEAITTAAKAANNGTKYENIANATFTQDVELGMYLALVEPNTAGVLYNPIIVSADYSQKDPNTNSIDASKATMGETAVAKKDTVTVTKVADNIDHNTNDYVKFTVTTTIPAYSDSYTNLKFNVGDKLSTGLTGVVDSDTHKFEVSSGSVTYTGAPSNGFKEFTLVFDPAKIGALVTPQPVTITYWAQVTSDAPKQVNQEDNDVTVTYSNNPQDDTDYDELYDETRHYTFDIDGQLFGDSSKKTAEVVKVGVDQDGKWIEETVTLSNTTQHSALAGAEFGLYPKETTTFDDAHLYKNKQYPNGCKIKTTADGLMEIKGLDAGEYILKEISAPKGYIKDTGNHPVVITPTYETEKYTKTFDSGKTCEYDVQVLKSYTVTIDGTTTSYENTLVGPSITEVTHVSGSSAEIKNTKGVELPSTGGVGTTIFYVVGAILVLGAGVILVTRRRVNAN